MTSVSFGLTVRRRERREQGRKTLPPAIAGADGSCASGSTRARFVGGVPGNSATVTNPDESDKPSDADPIDKQAATIDVRSENAPEEIAELVEHAEELGRDVEDSPIRPSDEAPDEVTSDDPAVTGEIDGD